MKRTLATSSLALALLAPAASAQIGFGNNNELSQGQQGIVGSDVKLDPPGFNVQSNGGVGFMPMIAGFLFLGLVLGVCLIPSKRGHQD